VQSVLDSKKAERAGAPKTTPGFSAARLAEGVTRYGRIEYRTEETGVKLKEGFQGSRGRGFKCG